MFKNRTYDKNFQNRNYYQGFNEISDSIYSESIVKIPNLELIIPQQFTYISYMDISGKWIFYNTFMVGDKYTQNNPR